MRNSLPISLVLLTAVAFLGGCGPLPSPRAPSYSGPSPPVYQVRRGDTLYSIAQRFGMDHRKLKRWNSIRAPASLEVGQKLRLQPVEVKSRPQVEKTGKKAARWERQKPSGGPDRWQWPVKGRIRHHFSQDKPVNNGIDIAAETGVPVRAAASGTVVYSGDGLHNYGNLVVLRHADRFITTYAYNREILVVEKDWVEAGQVIARVGQTGAATEPSLHFEVRHRTEPINPMRVLPRR